MDRDLKTFTVLVVDDEVPSLLAIKNFLSRRFKKVFIAYNGEEGLSVFMNYQPDLIISDVQMPKMNGYEMVKKIIEFNPLQKIIMLSGSFSEDWSRFPYLSKPFNEDLLIEAIHKCLNY